MSTDVKFEIFDGTENSIKKIKRLIGRGTRVRTTVTNSRKHIDEEIKPGDAVLKFENGNIMILSEEDLETIEVTDND